MEAPFFFLLWCVGGPFVFALLHRIPAWPRTRSIGWACLALCGPLTWFLMFCLWIQALDPHR